MHNQDSKGFTLIEVIVCMTILAIFAIIFVPSYINFSNESRMRADNTKFVSVATALKSALSEPDVAKEAKLLCGEDLMVIKWSIDQNGTINFANGTIEGTAKIISMQDSDMWKNIYADIGNTYDVKYKRNIGKTVTFTLKQKTEKTTASCTFELSK